VVNAGTTSAAVFNFGIPSGQTGATGSQGPAGTAATATAGTTTTGAPGTSASVVNAGTTSAAVFNFTIPRGGDWRYWHGGDHRGGQHVHGCGRIVGQRGQQRHLFGGRLRLHYPSRGRWCDWRDWRYWPCRPWRSYWRQYGPSAG
jgi:hypothetical protein